MHAMLFPHVRAEGAWQMAADQALLELGDGQPDAVLLRTYEWSEPTLSLGYFQSYGDVIRDSRWEGVPVVRRPSGGGALWHHHELTYAVIVPRSLPVAHRAADLYRTIHEGLATWLRLHGYAASRRNLQENQTRSTPSHPDARPFLCFLDQDPEDVVVGSAKIVGSAQRRRPRAVLQHGSVLHSASPTTPELLGLSEVCCSKDPGTVESWSHVLPQILAQAFELEIVKANWPESFPNLVQENLESHFANPAWTHKR